MAKQNKNGLYLIALLVLIGIFLIVKYVFVNKPDSNFDMNVLKIDTANVVSIVIKQPKDKTPIKLSKENNMWKVSQDDKTYDADENSIKEILGVLNQLKIQNIVGTSKDKWADYELTDSAATEVQLFDSQGKIFKNISIGKFTYKQNNSPYGQMSGRNNILGMTYIRLSNRPESFMVNGFIPMTFNRELNSFRNQTVVKIDKNNVNRIKFQYVDKQNFEIDKTDSAVWTIDNNTADFNKITQYLNFMTHLRHMQFDDNFKPGNKAMCTLTYIGENILPTTIRIYKKDSINYIVNSSQNPKTFFSYKEQEVIGKLTKSVSDFMIEAEKK